MLIKIKFSLVICALFLIGPFTVRAQETKTLEAGGDEVLRVNTRVVFLDALVREKRTGAAVSDLKLENFEVLADGRRREVSYCGGRTFSRRWRRSYQSCRRETKWPSSW
ncbi:MAG: hypothetical protein LC742_02550 [Acidobacteria bacterium]|nr:hypothetical protein [Acidobacteriota bacterium]